jgi:hypothetical protein
MNEWEKRRYAKTVAEVVVGGFANLTLHLFKQATFNYYFYFMKPTLIFN